MIPFGLARIRAMTEKDAMDNKNRKLILAGGILGGITTLGLTGFFVYGHYYPNTPDAYVHAYTVTVAPYVAGYIKNIHIQPNQFVKKGELIYEIVPDSFQVIVDQKASKLEASKKNLKSMHQELQKAKDDLKSKKASRWIVGLNQKRYAFLLDKDVVSLEKEQELQASTIEADADVTRATAEIRRISQKLLEQKSLIEANSSELGTAKINFNYAKYFAPFDGFISNKFTIRTGQYVKPGQALFQIVDNSQWWVDANYKESQIHRIRPGMKASIKLDMYPGKKFEGTVINISSGSGAYYSLLPPQNATGNWVKVPQRFPVRIKIEQSTKHPLRAGSTAHSTVNTVQTVKDPSSNQKANPQSL
jgi:membrane fusion protein (multidrug efflux system)